MSVCTRLSERAEEDGTFRERREGGFFRGCVEASKNVSETRVRL